jgi:hypothetical protein
MKNKIFALLAIMAVLGLAIATYAYNRTSNTTLAKVSCCKNADSCPMKSKDGEHGKDHAKGKGHDCCGDSCPMKKDGGDHAKMEGHNCCGDSCPMKKKDSEAKGTAVSVSENGKNCCENCDCCKGKAKPETAAV